jgi:small-conductance mechanosensitive channel
VVAAALGVLVLTLGGLTTYLWITTDKWAAHSASLEGQAYDLGQRLSTEEEYVVQQTEQIDILTQQLSTAQQSITDLAAQSAQAGDDVAYAQQENQYLNELVSLGGSVSLALNRCVNEQKTLVDYLQNSASYPAEGIAQFKSEVDALCAAAQSANAELQKQLAQ